MSKTTQPGTPIKILHIAQTAHGGVGSYLEEMLAVQVCRHGKANVRVVLPQEHADCFPGLPSECLLPFHSGHAGRRVGSAIRMGLHAMNTVRRWKPDIVHLHATFAGFVMRPLLALMPGAPTVIYCAHGWSFERRKINPVLTYSMATAERVLSRFCAAVICVSEHEAARANAVGIPRTRLKVVTSGIADMAPLHRDSCENIWPEGRTRILFVGRLDHEKGVDVLLDAMKVLGDRAFAIVVGSAVVTGYQYELERADNVRFMGWVERAKIMPMYATADIVVVPSRYEAFGLTAVEAMRAGLPVVASRVGGLSELVLDRVTGRLVDPGDPQQLAAAVGGLDRRLRAIMGANARQRFLEAFRIERVAEELEVVYQHALGLPISQQVTPALKIGRTGT